MKYVFLVLGIAVTVHVSGQGAFVKIWDRDYGSFDRDIVEKTILCSDGGYLLAGSSSGKWGGDKSEANRGYDDFWVVKVDADGVKQWDHTYGGSSSDILYTADEDSNGNFLFGGSTNSGLSGDKSQDSQGGADFWLVKTDNLGNLIWDKRFGGPGDDLLYDLEPTNDNGWLLTGASNSNIGGDKSENIIGGNSFHYDYWLVKIDSNGDKLWDKTIGGVLDDFGLESKKLADGSFIVGGFSESDSGYDKSQNSKGNVDYWILKLSSSGQKLWDKTLGGNNGDYLVSFVVDDDESFFVGGNSYSDSSGDKTSSSVDNLWFLKLSTEGDILWQRSYGGQNLEKLSSLQRLGGNGYLICAESQTNDPSGDKSEWCSECPAPWILKINNYGSKIWDKSIFLSGTQNVASCLKASDGCYAVSVATNGGIHGYKSQDTWGGSGDSTVDYWLMKFCMEPVDVEGVSNEMKVSAYPNPFMSNFSININNDNLHQVSFVITNSVGQIVCKKAEQNLASNYTKNLDLSYLASGVYFLEVILDTERVVRRIIKE